MYNYFEIGQYVDALRVYTLSLDIKTSLYGELDRYNSKLASINERLAKTYANLGRKKKSRQHRYMAQAIGTSDSPPGSGCLLQ